VARFLYIVAVLALLPWAFLYLLWRSRRQPQYRRHWRERLGFFSGRSHGLGRTVWIHAVSVGETRAAQPLVAALRSRYPELRIVISHMTPTGRETSQALFGTSLERVFLPYDTPGAMRRFLDHFQPTIGLIVETELWPNLVAACERRKLPLLLVNARLSARSAGRYARFPTLTRQTLRGLSAVAAQGDDDAQRLRDLGAREVTVLGNMKFDIEPPPAQLALGLELRAGLGKRPLLLCASTREGEEALILDAWQRLGNTDVLLALVPRHPQRFDEVAAMVAERGLTVCRRSANILPTLDTAVWLGDSMGELFAWYAAADVAFVGGSLLDHGCQNLIEACAVGAPVLIGPSTFNFADAARAAIDAQAAIQVPDAAAMIATALDLIGNPARRAVMAEAGRAFATRHGGATARTMALIERFIPESR
jgi:3-deoxy-D-manno-octulosonic-acid transferase